MTSTPFVDPDAVAVIAVGDPVPAALFGVIRDDLMALVVPPGAQCDRIITQSVPDNTLTNIEFIDPDIRDTDGFHSPTVDPETITIPSGLGGRYQIDASAGWADGPGTRRTAYVTVNGTIAITVGEVPPAGAGVSYTQVSRTRFLQLNAGDEVRLQVIHDAGTALACGGELTLTWSGQA